MTKSIDKAVKGSVLIKGKKNDKEPSYILPNDLVVNDETLENILNNNENDINDLFIKDKETNDIIKEQANEIKVLRDEIKSLKNDLQGLKEHIRETIERWVEL